MSQDQVNPGMKNGSQEAKDEFSILDLAYLLVSNWKKLIFAPVLIGVLTWAVTLLMAPIFTAKTVILTPQQQNNSAVSALQSLGALTGLAGAGASVKSPADQYVALMRSDTMSDRIISAFKLADAWGVPIRQDARDLLQAKVRIAIGKKDGLITIEVDDTDPKRAASVANRYVEELRKLTNELGLTESQQRRQFFERQLQLTNEKLVTAQRQLQSSGINEGALRAEPKAAADSYADLKAQVTAAEIRIQSMRRFLTEDAQELKQALASLAALRVQLSKAEAVDDSASTGDYIAKYRDFKYQENLFELFAKQFEMAKLDESRDAAFIQVVDVATPPERKSKPVRLTIAAIAACGSGFVLLMFLLLREGWRKAMNDEVNLNKAARLKGALRT